MKFRLLVLVVVCSAMNAQQPQRALLDQYCVTCHNQKLRTGGLSLDSADLNLTPEKIPANPGTWEKVLQKVKGGFMPPAGAPRPAPTAMDGLVAFVESAFDRAATAQPNPGRVVLHRLNRAEYANVIRDLLDLNVDVEALLPPDDSNDGFDNMAATLSFSPISGSPTARPAIFNDALR